MFPLRRRYYVLVFVFVVLLPFFEIVLFSGPDLTNEQVLMTRLTDMQVRLQFLDTPYRTQQEDVIALFKSMNGIQYPPDSIRLPNVYNFMPHLLEDSDSLRPAYLLGKGRAYVSMILGVPTVKRDKQNYLMDTLQSLLDAISFEEARDTIIVVFIGETDLKYVLQVAKEIELRFALHLYSDVIEIISPSASYYPDFDKLHMTRSETPEMVKWRSKQNLDYAYLMSYAQFKCTFYVQLEDDILATKNFVSIMKQFAIEKSVEKIQWFVLDFCRLGFIGKLFKSAELPWLIQYFQMFFNDSPVDWLLEHYWITTRKYDTDQIWVRYKTSLFQHIGIHSSLKGKVQKLRDKQFTHINPKAEVESGIKAYKSYTLKQAYLGENFFWGPYPKPGDQFLFKFTEPIKIKTYLFRTGNAKHPTHMLYNTTVEVQPVTHNQITKGMNVTNDGYIVIGKFDSTGVAEGMVDENVGLIKVLRLNVHSKSNIWVMLSEIHIQEDKRLSRRVGS